MALTATDSLARAGLRLTLERAGVEIVAAAEAEVLVWDMGAASVRDDALGRALSGSVPVVVLVASGSSARDLLANGARGVLSRDADGPRLASALSAARAGVVVLDPDFVSLLGRVAVEAFDEADELTPRESEVLSHLASGLANKEIAVKLGISDHTVKFHVNAILEKLGASTRTEAVVRGVRRGIVSI